MVRHSRRIKTPSKRRMTAALIRLCQVACRVLPFGVAPTAIEDGSHLAKSYRDELITIRHGPAKHSYIVWLNKAKFMPTILQVDRGEVISAQPHKRVMDHLRRLLVLDQLVS